MRRSERYSTGWAAWTALVVLATAAAQQSPGREVTSLNLGWRYHRGDAGPAAASADFAEAGWERVAVPHTYQLASINLDDCDDDSTQPTFHRDLSWYRRELPVEAGAGDRVFIEFEGAHQITDLWVNGQHAGRHATGGFTPFHFDITELVTPGSENTVAIRLDNRRNPEVPPDGSMRDYVLFGGLYRDVRLVVTRPLRVTFPWEAREAGVRITTPSVSAQNATVTVETVVENTSGPERSCRVVTRIADATGLVVEKLVGDPVTIGSGRNHTFVQTGGVREGLRLWSPDSPYLYRVHTTIEAGGDTVDRVSHPLGFRWFDYEPGTGFRINGEPTELIGANRHQQYPYVGDAVPNNLHRADAIKFKRAGLNVVRLAHYPHDDAFLDACDELGILVYEEAPTWIEAGPPLWMDRLERGLRVMIRNHRNHPCVWGWAVGINHRGPNRRLHYAAKQEDPTRITFSNSTLWTGPTHSGVTDLYAVMDYRGAVVPEGEPLFAMEHGGSLDATGHQRIVARYKRDPARIGLTLWSAHDGFSFKKRGEEFPNLSVWRAALWDPFRTPKPAYHWYRSELNEEPMIRLTDDRVSDDAGLVVFTNCEEVEVVVNGESSGRVRPRWTAEQEGLRSPPVTVPVEWHQGEAVAIGYRDGAVAAEHRVRKPGSPVGLEVHFDPDTLEGYADGSSILLAAARVVDRNGTVVTRDTPGVGFRVEGPAEIVGDASIGANPVSWKRGVAPVLLRVGKTPGTITLTAEADGLRSGEASVVLAAEPSRPARFPPPREPLLLRVDMGGTEQHVEEGWTGWHADSGHAEIEIQAEGDSPSRPRFTLSAVEPGSPIAWTSRWGVPGDLSSLIEDGAEAEGGLRLKLEGLPAGVYRIRSWHHRVVEKREEAPRLDFVVTGADGRAGVTLPDYSPTYGKKVRVSDAGGGGAGDGGSNLAAAGFAQMLVTVTDGQPILIEARPAAVGRVVWSGFEVSAMSQTE